MTLIQIMHFQNLTSEVVAKRVLTRNGGLKEESEGGKGRGVYSSHVDQHKEGVAKAHHSIRLQPLKHNPSSFNISTSASTSLTYGDKPSRLFSGKSCVMPLQFMDIGHTFCFMLLVNLSGLHMLHTFYKLCRNK